jgi:hypothetical protein
MPISINGKTYALPTDDGQKSITAREQMLIEREFKRPMEKLFAGSSIPEKALRAMSDEKRDAIEVEKRLAFLLMIWISRLRAGENLTFEEATDIELDKLLTVEDAEKSDPLEGSSEEELKSE